MSGNSLPETNVVRQDETINQVHYAKKQLLCRDWLISWSHRSRFQIALRLARQFAGKRIMDYGCGDGTFLAMLMKDAHNAPGHAVGVETHSALVEDCRFRFVSQQKLEFVKDEDLRAPEHRASYDAVFCMEVLEHVRSEEHTSE